MLRTSPGATVSGRVVLEDAPGGQHLSPVLSRMAPSWFLKAILVNGFDVADVPFDFGFEGRAYTDLEVVFSRAAAAISGLATDDRTAPVWDYAVIVFPTNREHWFAGSRWVKVARAAADGGFRVAALPPGDYGIAAVDRVDTRATAAEWQDPQLLETLALRAMRITIGHGQSQVLTLRLLKR